mmetsp:Transcript_2783/g.4524  ORF Transcript_2783/g.4524 Transcript_2783/m.4524 type:complete len:97 (+) Transcript_2783:740-1030(+)
MAAAKHTATRAWPSTPARAFPGTSKPILALLPGARKAESSLTGLAHICLPSCQVRQAGRSRRSSAPAARHHRDRGLPGACHGTVHRAARARIGPVG